MEFPFVYGDHSDLIGGANSFPSLRWAAFSYRARKPLTSHFTPPPQSSLNSWSLTGSPGYPEFGEATDLSVPSVHPLCTYFSLIAKNKQQQKTTHKQGKIVEPYTVSQILPFSHFPRLLPLFNRTEGAGAPNLQ